MIRIYNRVEFYTPNRKTKLYKLTMFYCDLAKEYVNSNSRQSTTITDQFGYDDEFAQVVKK